MTERADFPPQPVGLCRNSLAPGHPLVGHDVQRPAPHPRLGRLPGRSPARHAVTEDRLHPEHRRLRQRPLVVTRLLLPRRPPGLPDAEEVPSRLIFAPRRGEITPRADRPSRGSYPSCRSYAPSAAALSIGFSTCP